MFAGKVCSILTTTVAKTNFQDHQFADFFSVIIESIDEDGVFGRHLKTKCLNYYNWQYVVGIIEEQTIAEDDPKYNEIMQEVKKAPKEAQKTIVPFDPGSAFIDLEAMTMLTKQAKESQGKMLRKQ